MDKNEEMIFNAMLTLKVFVPKLLEFEDPQHIPVFRECLKKIMREVKVKEIKAKKGSKLYPVLVYFGRITDFTNQAEVCSYQGKDLMKDLYAGKKKKTLQSMKIPKVSKKKTKKK